MFNIHFTIERWRKNRFYNVYVSTEGRVKDANKKIIEPNIGRNGYFFFKIGEVTISAHRLVMETFKEKPFPNATIDHLNSNKRDNRLKNLEYVSQEENLERANKKLIDAEEKNIVLICEDEDELYNELAKLKEFNGLSMLSKETIIKKIKKKIKSGTPWFGRVYKRENGKLLARRVV